MGQRVTGTERLALSSRLRIRYDNGASIRELARAHQRSYSATRTLLVEAGTTLRARGGPRTEQ
jgi:hypothetical protein